MIDPTETPSEVNQLTQELVGLYIGDVIAMQLPPSESRNDRWALTTTEHPEYAEIVTGIRDALSNETRSKFAPELVMAFGAGFSDQNDRYVIHLLACILASRLSTLPLDINNPEKIKEQVVAMRSELGLIVGQQIQLTAIMNALLTERLQYQLLS